MAEVLKELYEVICDSEALLQADREALLQADREALL